MKLEFRQSGGFAGLIRAAELDTEKLARREAARIETLVRQLLEATPEPKGRTSGADIIHYELTVDDGQGPPQFVAPPTP